MLGNTVTGEDIKVREQKEKTKLANKTWVMGTINYISS